MGSEITDTKELLPVRLEFRFIDYLKALVCWIFSYRRTYIIEPGLYYIGKEYDVKSPLLTTCNYHLTVFLLWRILKKNNVRILVVDTKGINVWCSSGKGQFSADTISEQLNRYEWSQISDSEKVELVLPKLSLSGVSLSKLKNLPVIPRIGPVYASKLPAYLKDKPLKDMTKDKYLFTLRNRLFTMLPSIIQFTKYLIIIAVVLFAWHYFFQTGISWQVIPIGLLFIILYILFFPVLPTKRFCIKGLVLLIPFIVFFIYLRFFMQNPEIDNLSFVFYIIFTAGLSLFFSLYYTGNSGVSNYSLVKKEIVQFLPVTFILFVAAVIILIIKGVTS